MRGLLWLAVAIGCAGCAPGAKVRVELADEGSVAAEIKEEKKGPDKRDTEEKPPPAGKDDPTKKAEPFVLPDDDAGRLLGKAIAPARLPARLDAPRRTAALPPPGALAPPTLIEESMALVDRLPSLAGGRARPRFARPEAAGDLPSLPPLTRPTLEGAKLARVEAEDVTVPPPLLPGAVALPDRVPLDDPTAGLSAAAVLTAPLPARTAAAAYLRMGPPDPFEHRRPVTLAPPGEATAPRAGAPRGPSP